MHADDQVEDPNIRVEYCYEINNNGSVPLKMSNP